MEPHAIGLSPWIQSVQSLPTLQHINAPQNLTVVCELTGDALDPLIHIINKVIKQDWPKYYALGNLASAWKQPDQPTNQTKKPNPTQLKKTYKTPKQQQQDKTNKPKNPNINNNQKKANKTQKLKQNKTTPNKQFQQEQFLH